MGLYFVIYPFYSVYLYVFLCFFSSKKSRACNHCYQKYNQNDSLSSSMISRLQDEEAQEDSGEEDQTTPKLLNPHTTGRHCSVN